MDDFGRGYTFSSMPRTVLVGSAKTEKSVVPDIPSIQDFGIKIKGIIGIGGRRKIPALAKGVEGVTCH